MSFVCLWAVGDGETAERFPASLGMAEGRSYSLQPESTCRWNSTILVRKILSAQGVALISGGKDCRARKPGVPGVPS